MITDTDLKRDIRWSEKIRFLRERNRDVKSGVQQKRSSYHVGTPTLRKNDKHSCLYT